MTINLESTNNTDTAQLSKLTARRSAARRHRSLSQRQYGPATRAGVIATAIILLTGPFISSHAQAIDTTLRHDGGGGIAAPQTPETPEVLRSDLSATQWHLDAINARELGGATGKGITVAVLADGVWANHPDLKGRVLPGWDATTSTPYQPPIELDEFKPVATIGTFTAALIAGSDDNAGIRGVAPEATILPIVVHGENISDETPIARAIIWAADNGADVIVYADGLVASIITGDEKQTCAAISKAKAKGVPTIVPAGSDYDYLDPTFFAARCADAISFAPLSTTLGEANGFRTIVSPTYSAPAVQIVSALSTPTWLPYASVDLADLAAIIGAGAFAALISDPGNSSDPVSRLAAANRAFNETVVDLDAPGVDARTGAGIIDLGAARAKLAGGAPTVQTKDQLLRFLVNKIPPVVVKVTADQGTNIGINWSPAAGADVASYEVRVHRWVGGSWTSVSYPAKADEVRTVITAQADEFTYFTVTAITKNSASLVSLPVDAYTVEPFESSAPDDAMVTGVTAKWMERGISVTVTTNKAGEGITWYAQVLDGWSMQPLFERKVTAGNDVLISVPGQSELRAGPLFIIATINGERIYTPLLPEYLIEAKLLAAGKGHVGVSGSAFYGCTPDMEITSGCEGAKVRIVDSRTKKTVATTYVLSDLTFSVLITWKAKMADLYAVIDRPAGSKQTAEVRSKLLTRIFTDRR
jgi:hypothetical protein